MNGVHLRDMTIDDCKAVATVRVRGWQSAYVGMVPQRHLDAMSVEADAARRRARLTGDGGAVGNIVAERDGRVIGWACYGPYREDADAPPPHREPAVDAELYAIYVLPEQHSTGAGRALLAEMLARAARDGFPRIFLWVLAENARARRFYEKAGFAFDGTEEPFELDGVSVPEVRYVRRLSAADAAAVSLG
ncbi:GNAT family N-acetyltransferase [Streptomyces sp. 21So2-11]|uniref:GNAT family N-acetyltransferase n=1 Tax=Streptomyces sp. 21So2-11 TaxID=3144408 RepID=UPI00321AE5B7